MYYSIIYTICTLGIVLYSINVNTNITTSIKGNLFRFKQNYLKKIWFIIKIFFQTFYTIIYQRINNNVKKIDTKTYEISYVINNKLYKMIVVPKRGPAPILQVSDENDNNITSYILPYMGPEYDWHGKKLKPRFFGVKFMAFQLDNGTEYTIED